MHTALALAPLTLVAVLAFSGAAKLGDPTSTASMIRLLRLPRVLHAPGVARALPFVELLTAALLLSPWRWTYAAGAAAALGLFTAFLVVVARAMTFDPRPTCGCFGRVGDHRINGRTVGRNVLLLGLALVTGWIALRAGSAASLIAEFGAGDWWWLVLAVALATVAVLILGGGSPVGSGGTPRTGAHTDAHDHGAPDPEDGLDYVRVPIPRGVLLSCDLQVVSLHELARERAQLLVLVNCWCGSTMEAIERLADWRDRLPQLDVQLVHTQRPWDEPSLTGVTGVWWDPGAAVYTALGAGASPAAVLLGADGLLAGGPVSGVPALDELVTEIADQLAEAATTAGEHG